MKGDIMENNHILTNEEFEIFQKFSIKMTPNTKKDYLSKVILFKEVIKVVNSSPIVAFISSVAFLINAHISS